MGASECLVVQGISAWNIFGFGPISTVWAHMENKFVYKTAVNILSRNYGSTWGNSCRESIGLPSSDTWSTLKMIHRNPQELSYSSMLIVTGKWMIYPNTFLHLQRMEMCIIRKIGDPKTMSSWRTKSASLIREVSHSPYSMRWNISTIITLTLTIKYGVKSCTPWREKIIGRGMLI